MRCRLELANISNNTISLQEAKLKYNKAKAKWEDLKTKAEIYREEEMLDYYNGSIEGDNEKEITDNRRKAVQTVKAKLQRDRSFHYLTKHLGKTKSALNKLKLVDPESKRIRTTHNRNEIESLLVQYNWIHLLKAINTAAYNDKLTKNLHKDKTGDKILAGELNRQDTGNVHLYEFMKLLKNTTRSIHTN